jgi:hypothetical protein
MSIGELILAALAVAALTWFLPNILDDRTIWCVPYQISQERQAERGIETVEVGKRFAPEPGIEHAFWCYQKD